MEAGKLLIPNQQSSVSGTRTTLMSQVAMAVTEASSDGPSKTNAPPPVHMYSLPERFTPSNRIVAPFPSTKWLPEMEIEGEAACADLTWVARELEAADSTKLHAATANTRV